MNKKEQSFLWMYNRATATELHDVYKSWSYAKERAFNACYAECYYKNGYGFRLTSHNCNFFSVAYKYQAEDGEHLRYHTAYNVFDFKID